MQQIQKIHTHHRDVKARIKSIDTWKIAKSDKEDLLKFLEDYRNGEITGKIGTNIDVTIERVIQYLKPPFEFISKKSKLSSLNKKSLELVKKFKGELIQDKIINYYGKPYGLRTKKMILYTFGKYIKWKIKPEYYAILSKPLLIKLESKEIEPDSFDENQLEQLYKACSTDAQRFLIIVLFSSGTRAEEFHNIRFGDIELPTKDQTFVKLRVQHGFSKTKGRTITLYHERALEVVRDYVELRKSEGCNPDDPLLKMSYGTGRKWLKRLGRRVLNINLHYHLFRSSCATWLASRMNRQQLCIFFGWKFNSPMPDIYISRNGLGMEEISNKFEKTKIETLKSKLEKSEHENKIRDEEFEELKQQMQQQNERLNLIQKTTPMFIVEKLEKENRPDLAEKYLKFQQQINDKYRKGKDVPALKLSKKQLKANDDYFGDLLK